MSYEQASIAAPRHRTRFFSPFLLLVPVILSAVCGANGIAWGAGMGSQPVPVFGDEQLGDDRYSPILASPIVASPNTAFPNVASPNTASPNLPTRQWFLHQMAQLHQHHSPQHAYQMGVIGVALYPSSPPLRAALIHAAIHANRCILAVPHLRILAGLPLSPMIAQWRRDSEQICLGGWRNSAHITASGERRKSLGSGNGVTRFAAEPGSMLHGLCTIMAGLCDPHALAITRPQRESGFEGWVTVSLQSRRLFADRTSTVRTRLLRRFTDNQGFGAHGISLGYQVTKYIAHRRSMLLNVTARSVISDQPSATTSHHHTRLGIMVGILRQSGRRRFSQMTVSYHQHMQAPISYERVAMAWGNRVLLSDDAQLNVLVETATTSFGSRARHRNASSLGWQAKVTLPSFRNITPWVGLMHRTDRYQVPLPYLAGRHSDHHRKIQIGAAIALDPDRQITLTLHAYRHKITSRNPLVAQDHKGIALYLNYLLSDRPETKP